MTENKFIDELVKTWGRKNFQTLSKVRVGLAGAGGLGSNCGFNLVRSGFQHLKIVDYDLVNYSNLNRQFFFYHQVGLEKVRALKDNLLKINPDLDVEVYSTRITPENVFALFQGCHILIEAFDDPVEKKRLIETYLSRRSDDGSPFLLLGASGLAGWGRSDEIGSHRIREDFYVVGDLKSEVTADSPPLAPRVNIVAAKQADLALEFVLSHGYLWAEKRKSDRK